MNQIELIKEAGRKAYSARKQHDEARCRFHTEWARKAARLEENQQDALKAFNEAYKAESELYR